MSAACPGCGLIGKPHDPCLCDERCEVGDRICFICKREAFHFLKYKERTVCGSCAPYSCTGERILITDGESEALDMGGQAGGEYLDSINKTDLATLTGDEWSTFLGKVLEGYSVHMRGKAAADPPF